MINYDLYEALDEKINGYTTQFTNFKQQFGISPNEEERLGLNSIKSLARQTMVSEEDREHPIYYSRLYYGKNGYYSLKISNLDFNLEALLNILANIKGVCEGEVLSCIMILFTSVIELRNIKVKLKSEMSIIVHYLFTNQYTKRCGREIDEQRLKEFIEPQFQHYGMKEQFEDIINMLVDLKVIRINDGMVQLIESVQL